MKNGSVHSSPSAWPDSRVPEKGGGEGDLELGTSRSRVNPLVSVYDYFWFVCNEMKVVCLNDEMSINFCEKTGE